MTNKKREDFSAAERAAMSIIAPLQETKEENNIISSQNEEKPTQSVEKTQRVRKEIRDNRLNLLITRELRDSIHLLADLDEKSINGWINDALEEYIESRSEDLEACRKLAAKKEALRKARRKS